MRPLAVRRRAQERRVRRPTNLARAFLISLAVHVIVAGFVRGHVRPPVPLPPKREIFVVTSTARTIAKRTIPQAHVARRTAAARPASARLRPSLPRVVPSAVVPRRVLPAPVPAPVPPRVRSPQPHPKAVGATETVAAMERRFAETIREERGRVDPLRVPLKPETAPTHMPIPMIGIHEGLRGGQGIYRPLDRGRRADGWDYYYVSYEFEWQDGTYERGNVPWPIRFRPEHDPFLNNFSSYVHVPLAGPLPDWKLPPGTYVGRALRGFLPP